MFSTVILNHVSGLFLEMDALDTSLLSKHHPSSVEVITSKQLSMLLKGGGSSVRWGESICDKNPLNTSYKHRLTILIEVIYSTCIDGVFI